MRAGQLRRHRAVVDISDEPMINLTPLIDVVFVVLIVFILVAPMLEVDKVILAPGGEKTPTLSEDTREIRLHVDKDDKVRLNGRLITLDALLPKLVLVREAYPNARPLLFHDEAAHFGTYQRVKNAVGTAGFQQLDVALQSK